ncbi:hypothetical protein ACH5RR_032424 [Cinchona calisaya]|uniref:Uncharacterized protein n=1 Tax=Cinchona calisaya TaxID=153742 RepID=A0ABD2YI19_9GENT
MNKHVALKKILNAFNNKINAKSTFATVDQNNDCGGHKRSTHGCWSTGEKYGCLRSSDSCENNSNQVQQQGIAARTQINAKYDYVVDQPSKSSAAIAHDLHVVTFCTRASFEVHPNFRDHLLTL